MESLIKVRIVEPNNRIICIQCRPGDKINDLYKRYIENGGDKNNNQIKFGREVLRDWDQTLSYFNIEDGDVISVNEINESLIEVIIEDYKCRQVSVRCRPSDKMSDLYKKYVENGGNKYIKYPQFKYDGMHLNMSATLSYYDIEDGDRIILVETTRGGGVGMVAKFTDPEKDGPVEISTVKDEPDYLIACDGLNLFGNCLNKGCIVYNKEVAHQLGFGTYDVIVDRGTEKKPVCPKCKVTFIPITARIKNCRYEFIGQKIENDKVQHVDDKNETYGRDILMI